MGLLQQTAMKVCEERGHDMTPFTSYSETNAVASCWTCHMEVRVITNPKPNEIEIGGEAVAIECDRSRK